jgi:hypothetical protein
MRAFAPSTQYNATKRNYSSGILSSAGKPDHDAVQARLAYSPR